MRRMRHSPLEEQVSNLNQISRTLCVLRHGWQHPRLEEGPSCCGVSLAQDAKQPELERFDLVDEIPADQTTVSCTTTQAVSPLRGAASSSYSAVNQLLKSVVRKICTLRSVGTGAGRPPRLPGGHRGNWCPYSDPYARKPDGSLRLEISVKYRASPQVISLAKSG